MIAIINYGVGNLFSIKRSLEYIGCDSVITDDGKVIRQADHIILPGVGAFGDAVLKLRATGLDATAKEQAARGVPLLGICVGMQMLFDESLEYGTHEGLHLIPGQVVRIEAGEGLKIPHIGWNALEILRPHPVFQGVGEGAHVYFVHSYHAACAAEDVIARTDYGIPITAAVARENVVGCQFHPEKSGNTGLRILKNFSQM